LTIDKPKLNPRDFAKTLSLKLRAMEILGERLAGHIQNATLVFDEFGGQKSQTKIRTTIQRAVRTLNQTGIKRVAFNRSRSNDLLQLADVLASCIGQSFSGEETAVDLCNLLKCKEITSVVWPE
jgi:hypothetical protein